MSTPAGLRPSRRLRRVLAGLLLLAPTLTTDAGAAQAETAAQTDAPAPPVVAGVVLDGASTTPVAGATVASGTETVVTDAAGRFSVTLAPDDAELQVAADGYLETAVALDPAVTGAGAALEILLFRNTFAETVQVVSAPAAVPERPSATPIAAEQVFEVAGAFDNIFRTLDTLPGVASTGDFGSRLAVRGGTPDQNLTVMDGVEIHNPYRLFGLVSAFNPETVERFELTAGGFGAKYGDRLSSLLVVDNRAGERDFGGSSSAGVTDANVVLEGGAPTTTWSPGSSPTRTSPRSPTCRPRRSGRSDPVTGWPCSASPAARTPTSGSTTRTTSSRARPGASSPRRATTWPRYGSTRCSAPPQPRTPSSRGTATPTCSA